MSTKKRQKLEQYIQQGKVICGTADSVDKIGREVTTIVCLSLTSEKLFEVSIEVYYSNIDIRELNLRDETQYFSSLNEAISFLERETNIKFLQLHT